MRLRIWFFDLINAIRLRGRSECIKGFENEVVALSVAELMSEIISYIAESRFSGELVLLYLKSEFSRW